MTPLDYSLCCQTVTAYGVREENVKRQVLENCYFAPETGQEAALTGKSRLKKFLLIIPGDFPLQTGDRIFAGIGPEVTDWETFLPAAVEELYEISFVKPCYWDGELVHWEAGNRKETL